jgi:hypothetical protein
VDSLAGLEEKASKQGCVLCRLLLHGIQSQMIGRQDIVHFARVGSYLIMEDSEGQAIANLYTMPGIFQMKSNFALIFPHY